MEIISKNKISWNWFISFHEFFGLDCFKFSGPQWYCTYDWLHTIFLKIICLQNFRENVTTNYLYLLWNHCFLGSFELSPTHQQRYPNWYWVAERVWWQVYGRLTCRSFHLKFQIHEKNYYLLLKFFICWKFSLIR